MPASFFDCYPWFKPYVNQLIAEYEKNRRRISFTKSKQFAQVKESIQCCQTPLDVLNLLAKLLYFSIISQNSSSNQINGFFKSQHVSPSAELFNKIRLQVLHIIKKSKLNRFVSNVGVHSYDVAQGLHENKKNIKTTKEISIYEFRSYVSSEYINIFWGIQENHFFDISLLNIEDVLIIKSDYFDEIPTGYGISSKYAISSLPTLTQFVEVADAKRLFQIFIFNKGKNKVNINIESDSGFQNKLFNELFNYVDRLPLDSAIKELSCILKPEAITAFKPMFITGDEQTNGKYTGCFLKVKKKLDEKLTELFDLFHRRWITKHELKLVYIKCFGQLGLSNENMDYKQLKNVSVIKLFESFIGEKLPAKANCFAGITFRDCDRLGGTVLLKLKDNRQRVREKHSISYFEGFDDEELQSAGKDFFENNSCKLVSARYARDYQLWAKGINKQAEANGEYPFKRIAIPAKPTP